MAVNLISGRRINVLQLMDPRLKGLAEELESKDNKYFTLIDGVIFKNYKEKHLFVIPENMVYSVIKIYHDDMGHVGAEKTDRGILDHY